MANVLDQFVSLGKHPKVCTSAFFAEGMKVSIRRPDGESWPILAKMTIAKLPKDRQGWPTNEIIFTEPMPKGIKPGDVLVYESGEDNG